METISHRLPGTGTDGSVSCLKLEVPVIRSKKCFLPSAERGFLGRGLTVKLLVELCCDFCNVKDLVM